MKTKLLLLLLIAFSFAKAQINVFEGFESAITPTGWIYDGFARSTNIASSGSASLVGFFTSATPGSFSTANYVTNGTQINISFRARRLSTAVFDTNIVNYSVNDGSWVQLGNSFGTNNSNPWPTYNFVVPAGVVPSGSSIKFQVVSSRSSSSGNLELYFDNISILQGLPPMSTVAEYNFDNTYNNVNGNTPFSSNSDTSFVTDRHGNSTGALNLNFAVSQATIPYLPIANEARSVSVWIKPSAIGAENVVFSYGANSTNNSYGCSYGTNTITNFGFGNDVQSPFVFNVGNWKHVVCTYTSAGMATIYIDGVSIISDSKPTWNTVNSVFRLGFFPTANNSNISFDDLKIYNYALSQTEITNLFNNNSLTIQNFNQNNLQVALYPNPAKDMLNIEMKNEVKSIEIYTIQGQKVKAANQKQINTQNLAAGIYLVNITDTNNNKISKKIVIK